MRALALVFVVIAVACGGAPASSSSTATVQATASVAPTPSPTLAPPKDLVAAGSVRIAYRVQGNLIKKDANGTIVGLIPDLAAELGRRLGVKVVATEYPTTDAVLASAKAGAWDLTFDTVDTTKTELEFTSTFVEIPLSYLVPSGSKIAAIADVDRAGVRIAVLKGDTVDRFLTSSIKNATIQRYDTDKLRNDALASGAADVLPGSLTALIPQSQTMAGSRILDGNFLTNRWALAVPKGNAELLRYLNAFVLDVRSNGLVKNEIDQWKLVGVQIGTS